MNDTQLPDDGDSGRDFSVLSNKRQRRVLSILLGRSRPISTRELAVQIATGETETAPSDVSERDLHRIRTDLYHRCLPSMEATGVIEHGPEGITADEELLFQSGEGTFPDLTEYDQQFWEAASTVLSNECRQAVVSIVAGHRRSLTLEELVAEVAENTATARERRKGRLSLAAELYHLDLPKLADVGVIEFDPAEKTVSSTRRGKRVAERLDLGDGSGDGPGSY